MNETFAIELTPSGRGAVAVVLVDGPDAARVVDEPFVSASGRRVSDAPLGRILFGRWGGPGGEELIVCRRAQQQVEIHCHGGVAAVDAVLGTLIARGCRRLTWQEWLSRTSEDPIQSAAQIALAAAPTARSAAILLDQYNGALSRALESVIAAATSDDWPRALEIIERMLALGDLGRHLTTPWRVVLAGAPNVGKSSLINALAGFERAIVAPTPGTTRDVVTTRTALDGWPVELADTAGLRLAADEIESAGVALATRALAAADLVLLVRDASVESQRTEPIAVSLPPMTRILYVWNKIDLITNEAAARLKRDASFNVAPSPDDEPLLTSAVTGEGVAVLVSAIAKKLAPAAPPAGAAVPFDATHLEALQAARFAIAERDAQKLRHALKELLPVPQTL